LGLGLALGLGPESALSPAQASLKPGRWVGVWVFFSGGIFALKKLTETRRSTIGVERARAVAWRIARER